MNERRASLDLLVGLDIGSGFIKLLKVDFNKNHYRVENGGIVTLPAGAIIKEELKDVSAVSEALNKVFKNAGVKTKNVALAIPRSSAIIKTIMVDSRLNSADIESRAWVEANHHFPDLIGDIYLDFDIVGPNAEDPSQLDLLLVACRKDQVKPYLDVLQDNGLTVKVIDVNCYALERSLSFLLKKLPSLKTVALLNLDFSISSLIVSHEEQMIYAHDHSYEGFNFATQIETYLSDKKDKKGRLTVSLSDTAYSDILKAGMSAHLRHSMHFFYSSRPHIVIEKLFLSGDCASIPYLHAFIQKETGIETVVTDPLADLSIAPEADEEAIKKHSSTLMLSLGLALNNRINLLPWREQARKVKQKNFFIGLIASIGITLFIIFLFHLYYDDVLAYQDKRNDFLQSRIAQKQLEINALRLKKVEQDAIQEKLQFLIGLRNKSYRAVRLLNEILKTVPNAITLSKLTREDRTITIEGKAQSELAITAFMKSVSQSSIFNLPVLTGINSGANAAEISGSQRYFQLKVEQKI